MNSSNGLHCIGRCHWANSSFKASQTAKYQEEYCGWVPTQSLSRKNKDRIKGHQTPAQPASPTQEVGRVRTEGGTSKGQAHSCSCFSETTGSCSGRFSKAELSRRDLHQFMTGPEIRKMLQGTIPLALYLAPA